MSSAQSTVREEAFGVLTEAALERSRGRLGVPQPQRNPPHNYEVTWDAARHFAYGYGDDNPLYCEPEYAAGTRWGRLLAPPTFLYTMGEDAAPRPDAETKALLKGDPFAGLGSYQAVMEFEWWRPLALGDRCRVLQAQVGVVEKKSSFGGRTAHVTNDFLYTDGQGRMHAVRRGTWINAERHTSKKRAKEQLEQTPYTPEQLAEIDAAYAAETRRGSEPRYWEDVRVGDELQPRAKGPLTTTDVVVWHLGWGMQLTPPGAFRIQYDTRRKAPGLYPANALNAPDTVQRLHWEPQRAQELGLPTSYDYGGMRETWLVHAITDWMGDDAWLWKLRCEHRKFNYLGDTTWVRGRVVGKQEIDGRHEAHLEVWCENQRGQTTTPGTAVVLLPTRRAPRVSLPEPPAADLDGMVRHELRRHRVAG
ncbi:FAS1-like dehydratase domain-containing protein [Streptomyces fuscichromogenes]|uniref:Acyl dehydratase n=1 Tax=Streptomyces fuscichromogenes TaxID=1324013 RepID=A0A918CXB2_9ACTN|nr:MaoC family dehydratase N-terminal domain-containing protein [Streptomyces fuscichromogenes]GGN44181.1 acyl dehydratase [Streptomyces fuscichromogenes]